MKTNQLTGQVIGAAIEVHKALGPGLLESVYEEGLGFVLVRFHLKTHSHPLRERQTRYWLCDLKRPKGVGELCVKFFRIFRTVC